MNDLKLVLWHLPLDYIPAVGNIQALDVDFAAMPDLLAHLSDGWQVVSHTVIGTPDGFLLTLFLRRDNVVPDTPAGLS